MKEDKKYWFPAKRYGWGWGLPATWQGWLVLGSYLAALVIISFACLSARETLFFSLVAIFSGLLIAICCWKGGPPKWRWNSHKDLW